MTGSCERGNEHSCSVKCGKCDQVSICQLFKNDLANWSQLVDKQPMQCTVLRDGIVQSDAVSDVSDKPTAPMFHPEDYKSAQAK